MYVTVGAAKLSSYKQNNVNSLYSQWTVVLSTGMSGIRLELHFARSAYSV